MSLRPRPSDPRAARRSADAGRRLPAHPRPRPGLPAGVDRARPAGRPLLVPGRRAARSSTLDHGAADPFAPLREFLARTPTPARAGLPPFAGGVVGHLAYDAIHRFEPTVPLPDPRPDDVPGPSRFLLVPVVVAFDHVRQRVQVIAQPGHEAIADEITERLTGPTAGRRVRRAAAVGGRRASRGGDARASTSRWSRARQGAHHRRRRVPDRAVAAPPAADRPHAGAVYRALRAVNPSPYMFFLETDGRARRRRLARDARLADRRRHRRPCGRSPAPGRRGDDGAGRTTRWPPSCGATRRSAPST